MHGPTTVAEMPLDLTDDHCHRVHPKFDPTFRIEAVDRLDEADRPDLDDVVVLVAAPAVPPCDGADEREISLNQTIPRRAVLPLLNLKPCRRGVGCDGLETFHEVPPFRED